MKASVRIHGTVLGVKLHLLSASVCVRPLMCCHGDFKIRKLVETCVLVRCNGRFVILQ
jgi:hypothetical protein